MIVHHVETKLGVLEAVREPAQVEPVLAAFARLAIRAADNCSEGRGVGDRPEAKINFLAAFRDKVIRAKKSAGRIDARAAGL